MFIINSWNTALFYRGFFFYWGVCRNQTLYNISNCKFTSYIACKYWEGLHGHFLLPNPFMWMYICIRLCSIQKYPLNSFPQTTLSPQTHSKYDLVSSQTSFKITRCKKTNQTTKHQDFDITSGDFASFLLLKFSNFIASLIEKVIEHAVWRGLSILILALYEWLDVYIWR